MIVIVLRWHKAISWSLGESDATSGRSYSRPWWTNEAYYALAYTYAKLAEAEPVSPRLLNQEIRTAP